MRNEPLLRKVGDHIAENPKLYDQRHWSVKVDCGTVGCVAGQTAIFHEDFEALADDYVELRKGEETVFRDIPSVAREMLGLSRFETEMLFSATWKPEGCGRKPLPEAVRDALYGLAEGKTVREVSRLQT